MPTSNLDKENCIIKTDILIRMLPQVTQLVEGG